MTAAVGAEEPTKPGSFYGTVVSYSPGVTIVARARQVGTEGGGVETFQLTTQTKMNARVPQVGDGVGIHWTGTSAAGLTAVQVYAFAGGLPDQTTPAPYPSPGPSTLPRRHSFYGTVTSFSPPADGKPGSISAQPQQPGQTGSQTFVVTDQTQFHVSSAPQIGDWVGIVPDGTASDDLLALEIYVRPAGSPTAVATESAASTTTRPASTSTPAPDGSGGPDASTSAPTPDDAAAGLVVAYVAVIDGEDGVIEIRLRRPTDASTHVESFLIPNAAQVDVASTDGAVAAGDPVAITWEWRDDQRVALSVAIG